MKEFDINITETLEKTVTVEAETRADAEEKVRQSYYNSEIILDSENFTGVDFKTGEEREITDERKEMMDVLLIKPGMYPQAVKIGSELEDLQKAVGGDIEATYPFDDEVALVVNAEGKFNEEIVQMVSAQFQLIRIRNLCNRLLHKIKFPFCPQGQPK